MHDRFRCRRGCIGTAYKLGITVKKEHGEQAEVCAKHGAPVDKITKSEANGHGRILPPKKPPGVVRRVILPLTPALTR